MFRKASFLLFVFLLVIGSSYAGELASGEAVNYYNDGVKAQQSGNFTDAFTNYQKVLILSPSDTNLRKFILNNTGVIYAREGDLAVAEDAFKEALILDPNYTTAHLNLTFIYYKKGDRMNALEHLMRAYNINIEENAPTVFIIEPESGSED